MREFRASRPSPAMIVSVLALVAALAGTAVAADPTANSAASAKKKANKALKRAKKANKKAKKANKKAKNANQNAKAAQGSADNAQGAANSAQGAANSAQGSANQANSALGGVSLNGVRYVRTAADAGGTTILQTKGLRVVASCAGNQLAMVAQTTANDSYIQSVAVNTTTADTTENRVNDESFNVGDTVDLLATDDDEVNGHTEFGTPGGGRVTFLWTVLEGSGGFNDPECLVSGHAQASG